MTTNAPNFERSDVVFIQQGSSGSLRVRDENKWYLVKESWEGSQILDSTILNSYDTEAKAASALAAHNAAVTLGRKGGSANTLLQNKARARNGKHGGRPRKEK